MDTFDEFEAMERLFRSGRRVFMPADQDAPDCQITCVVEVDNAIVLPDLRATLERVCPCGREFTTTHRRQIYCRPDCPARRKEAA